MSQLPELTGGSHSMSQLPDLEGTGTVPVPILVTSMEHSSFQAHQ